MRILSTAPLALISILAAGHSAHAGDFDAQLTELARGALHDMATDPMVVAAVKAQNTAHAGLGQAEIDKLDQDWRAQIGSASAPLITRVQGAPVSAHLVALRDSGEGLYTEILLMDDKGLNVGVSDVTSDYWQGDEAKWQQTYAVGPDALHIGEVELDESSQSYQAQVSIPVIDPESGAPIGALTVGVNVELL